MKSKKIVIIFVIIIFIGVGFASTLISHNSEYIQTANYNESKYYILVDIEISRLYLLKNGEVIKEYSCSGGKWNTPSPIGTWKINKKAKWGEGFRRPLVRFKCSVGSIWNTWNFGCLFCRMGEFAWLY